MLHRAAGVGSRDGVMAWGVPGVLVTLDSSCLFRRIGVAPYLGFCQTFGDELSIPHCIARDAQVGGPALSHPRARRDV